jgi:hypothetical protein
LQIGMSGRVHTILSDGRQVRGYRKTLRRVQRRPIRVVRESGAPPAVAADLPSAEYPVALFFILPASILVSPGPHGFNVVVLPGNAVRIRSKSADHGFALARSFFAAVAKDRPGFTVTVCVSRDDHARIYGRHLTAVEGALVISGGLIEPRVYDAAQAGR